MRKTSGGSVSSELVIASTGIRWPKAGLAATQPSGSSMSQPSGADHSKMPSVDAGFVEGGECFRSQIRQHYRMQVSGI